MKKNDLVYVHMLLHRLASEYVERGWADREAFEAYAALDVSPMAIRAPRDAHAEAVRVLAAALADASAAADGTDSDRSVSEAC